MIVDYFVSVEGASIMGAIVDRLISLTVTDKAGLTSDTFDMVLDDDGDLIDPPRKGATVKIWIGYRPSGAALFQSSAGLTYMGEYKVDEVSVFIMPRRLQITGKAADMREKLKSPKTREFSDKQTMKKALGKIAAEHKLDLKISDDLGKIELPDFVQSEESDLHLASRLAGQYGAIVKYADGKMVVTKRGSGETASGKTMPTIIVTLADMKAGGRGRLKDRERYGSVSGTWHNQPKAKRETVKEKGASDGPDYELRQTWQTEAEARAACKAKLAELQRREADISFTMMGNPAVAAECKVVLVGVSRKLDGDWNVTQARHILRGTAPGYETQVEASTPGSEAGKGDGKKGK